MILVRKLFTLVALFGALTTSAAAQTPVERGPSTAEERARVATIVQASRKDPLGALAANAAWFEQWISAIPDYTLNADPVAKWCDRRATGELRGATRFIYGTSAVDYQIKHNIPEPKTPADVAAVSLAGLEGVLAAYEALLAKDPANRSRKMDAALVRRSKGELPAFVNELGM
ncbi:MAG: hypothetical protein QFF03_13970 [Pseudomonadota bacterium]|nr:hypothetical protein [Pseudomonadota bacterium]